MPRRMRRRLPRILLNAATVVSLVLCVASVIGFLIGIPAAPHNQRAARRFALGRGEG